MTTTKEQRIMEAIRATTDRIRREMPQADAEAAASLAEQFLSCALPEDLEQESADNLFGLAASVWHHARNVESDSAKIRAFNPNVEEHGWHNPHTVVEAVNINSPFLLDSTVAALNQLELTIHLVIHPVMDICRNESGDATSIAAAHTGGTDARCESVIHVQVTRQTEAADLERIVARLQEVYTDVRSAVEDWQPMLARVDELMAELRERPGPIPPAELNEGLEFLEWLRDGNFTFLGTRDYEIVDREGTTYLNIGATAGLGVLREVSEESRQRHEQPISTHYAEYLRRPQMFVISKAWTRSNVHRPVYMDYIGVRRFDAAGNVTGERRFLGLLTSTAYNTRPTRIPLLRQKVETVLVRSGFQREGHDAKALANILESFPRDELFQIDLDTLEETARGIVRLEHRQRIRLFLRRDGYGQFYSAQVFVPREAYSTDLRYRMEHILRKRLGGGSVEVATHFSEAPMVRSHFIVHVDDDATVTPDIDAIEDELAAAARNWDDDLLDTLIDAKGEAEGTRLHRRYATALPPNYKTAFSARAAVDDISRMELLTESGDVELNLYRRVAAEAGEIDFKVYHRGEPIPLSHILPMLEHMGLVVIEERPYEVTGQTPADTITIHDFRMHSRHGQVSAVADIRARFEDLFSKTWHGEYESDNFNCLVLEGLDGREIMVVRAYAKYLRQVKAPFSLSYMQETLAANPEPTRLIIAQFRALHDPTAQTDPNRRASEIRTKFEAELNHVASLDQDRILRRFLNLNDATLRTNFFQHDANGQPKPWLSFKFDSAAIAGLPSPRPWREIFVYSPRFEAVHLRGGPVARGGIRWSDRREDFRTEILGLVKAQMVKNAVIVPVGAKGGFVLKHPPADPAQLREEGVACYKGFMSGLLDLTDNLVGGAVQPPAQVLRHDGDDPYLVVAADKGTATFSDIANEVAVAYGHWLGDAFASGGSAGYDHKAMGITARGAWEAVKRHFRELGTDIQSQEFTVVGIGDMAGDVFGNGMLLSPHIRLVGAFNHEHIFVDPEPDAAKSFAERKRLFELPRSSWQDYDQTMISAGGGIFERQAKSIEVTPQMQARFDLHTARVTPTMLLRAMLRADVDLLWNGGIGTYVKARSESHADVDDRNNDTLRINGTELRCKVFGEGGNLGATQAGRIEFALQGGRVNTDAIDNAAGVDCSDHEVNIKILLGSVVDAGDMTTKQRDQQLAGMTDEVAALVLRDNYVQTQTLSMVESLGSRMTGEQIRFMRAMETKGLLDRTVEGLPNEEELVEWRAQGRQFTRPELAVLLAYAKMDLYKALLESELPDDPYLERDLIAYFPSPLQANFAAEIKQHRLRREIVATLAANDIIDRAGITFVHRHTEHSGISPATVVRAYLQGRDIFGLIDIWAAIEATDNQIPAAAQARMQVQLMDFADQITAWFLRNTPAEQPIADVIAEYQGGVQALTEQLAEVLDSESQVALQHEIHELADAGVPKELATAVARLGPLTVACDTVQAAHTVGVAPVDVGSVFFAIGDRFGCRWLRHHAELLPCTEHWDMLAAQALTEDSFAHQRALTTQILAHTDGTVNEQMLEHWVKENADSVHRFEVVFGELRNLSSLNLSMLNVVNRSLRVLTECA